jgi:hypothetical protein
MRHGIAMAKIKKAKASASGFRPFISVSDHVLGDWRGKFVNVDDIV